MSPVDGEVGFPLCESCVMCHVSCVTCHVSLVTGHLSLMPTATATDPPPTNSPFMQSWLVGKDPKKIKNQNSKYHWNNNNLKTSKGMQILAICSLTRCLQSTGKRVFRNGKHGHTDWRTSRLRDWIGPEGRCSENWASHIIKLLNWIILLT